MAVHDADISAHGGVTRTAKRVPGVGFRRTTGWLADSSRRRYHTCCHRCCGSPSGIRLALNQPRDHAPSSLDMRVRRRRRGEPAGSRQSRIERRRHDCDRVDRGVCDRFHHHLRRVAARSCRRWQYASSRRRVHRRRLLACGSRARRACPSRCHRGRTALGCSRRFGGGTRCVADKQCAKCQRRPHSTDTTWTGKEVVHCQPCRTQRFCMAARADFGLISTQGPYFIPFNVL